MRIAKKSMNWFPKSSAFDHQQKLRSWQKSRAQAYLNEQSSLANAFQAARDTQYSKITEVSIQTAVDRLKAATKAKLETNADGFEKTLGTLSKTA